MDNDLPSPNEFLRARRPERFSDSKITSKRRLNRSMLEYHLETLTSRSQESQFQEFARQLAMRRICPNLVPQTGPTGGGDSKVDTETYPVSESLALFWMSGDVSASGERWGFAVSAKEDWLPKFKSDIAKVAATDRGYKKAFFVTNQFISDKKRSSYEDELSKLHDMEIRILERGWILDAIFTNQLEEIAIKYLELDVPIDEEKLLGALDSKREELLVELESRIQDAVQKDQVNLSVVADCLHAALLARGLERPRTEIDGLFDRAERVAGKYGTRHQRTRCFYERAWTEYWWHEDLEGFHTYYEKVACSVKDSVSAADLEMWHTLWTILFRVAYSDEEGESELELTERTSALTKALELASADSHAPSNALQARTMLSLTRALTCDDGFDANTFFGEIEAILDEIDGLVGYPFEYLVALITELGDILPHESGYADLFDRLVQMAASRTSEVTAARMQITRGVQLLKGDDYYEAIRMFGSAFARAYKEESREDLVRALMLCAGAYEQVDLLWAARGALLSAGSLASKDLTEHSEVTADHLACYDQLKWIELRLGRIAESLEWYEVGAILENQIDGSPDAPPWLRHDALTYDGAMAIMLLRADLAELEHLSSMPDVLSSLGFVFATDALMYALGWEDKLSDELNSVIEEGAYELFCSLMNSELAESLPTSLLLGAEDHVSLSTSVLGCRILASAQAVSHCIDTAESILAALESIVATGVIDKQFARVHEVLIDVKLESELEGTFQFVVDDSDGKLRFDVSVSSDSGAMPSIEKQHHHLEQLQELLVHFISRAIVLGEDVESAVTRMIRDDRVLERAVSFSGNMAAVKNLLSRPRLHKVSGWCKESHDYGVGREEEWDAMRRKEVAEKLSAISSPTPTLAKGPPPHDAFDPSRVKHSEMAVISLIRESLWDSAKWRGTAYIGMPEKPPLMLLMFTRIDAGRSIFSYWRDELGAIDRDEKLHVSILKGIDKNNPNAYRIVIGSSPSAYAQGEKKFVYAMYRQQTMEPATKRSLELFQHQYEHFGTYGITCVETDGTAIDDDSIAWDLIIQKDNISIRHAWEVGLNDIDSAGIRPDDDPIIPSGTTAPITELLRKIRDR